MTNTQRLLPGVVVVLAAAYLLSQARPPANPGPFQLDKLARVPVSSDGRVKPLDTVARNSLMILSGRQSLRIDGERLPAIRWFADVVARPEHALDYKVFRIDHPEVLALMGLTHDDGKRFSFNTIAAHREELFNQARTAQANKPKKRTPFQRRVMKLANNLVMYNRLAGLRTPYMVPPLDDTQEWLPLAEAADTPQANGNPHPAVAQIASFLYEYSRNDPLPFNSKAGEYLRFLDNKTPDHRRKADFEVVFNHFQPFYHATVLYVLAFILGCFSFMLSSLSQSGWSRSLARATVGLLLLTLVLHTGGLVARVYLQGRPPVTNLYSSAVFVGWGCVVFALCTEWIYRLGLGSIVASLIGFITLIIAHHLGGDGDTMQMMQAVLDTNFWLATHVVAVTAGYSATFLAGALATLFILLGVFTPLLKPELSKALGQMVYGVVCFAMLLSFVGTVLGGIWADQSWGRFWGWDPKENGAILVVLMNVLILHARWCGMIRVRGMMVLAIGGNIVTSWSWFGTNMLGVGLHSYGFMDSALFWLVVYVLSQTAIMAIGTLPLSWWRSTTTPARA